MAKVTTEQARKLTNSTSSGYFSLKGDGDKAKVRFMYDKPSDIETFMVHEVKVGNFVKKIDCLKDSEGNGTCPFCEKGIKKVAKTFFKLYNADKNVVEVWECGIKRAPMIENILKMSRSPKLVNDCFEIVRHGQPNSTDTSYELLFQGADNISLQDLPKAPEIYGKYILNKSVAEMEYYITHNDFAPDNNKTSDVKPRNNRNVF